MPLEVLASGDILSVRDFIDTFPLFVILNPFTDNSYNINTLPDSKYVQFGIGTVSAENRDSLQSEQLFHDATVFTEVNHPVEFNVVTLPDEYTMLDNQLFGRDDIAQFVEIKTTIEHDARHDCPQYHKGHLIGDAFVTCCQEQGTTDKKCHAL